MQVKISLLQKKMVQGLVKRGLSKKEAQLVIEPFIEGEMREKKTHGIGKLFLLENVITQRKDKPKIIKDKFNYALIDAQKELGHLSALFATDLLIKKAKKFDNAVVAVKNSYYFNMANTYAEKVAKAGFVSIILANGGPAAVVPHGGAVPIFGTNPIAIGIPSKKGPIVLDMATSARTWGEINRAKVDKKPLTPNSFLDKNGNFTINPNDAVAILPFGDAKGYGLNLMVEIMAGALIGAKMGLQTQNAYDVGFLLMAFSPEMFANKRKFTKEVEQLRKEVKTSKPRQGFSTIYLPGEQSNHRLLANKKKGHIELDELAWNKLEAFAKGQDVKKMENLKE